MSKASWLATVNELFSRRSRSSHGPTRRRGGPRTATHLERLEERRVMAFDLVSAYATSASPFFVTGQSARPTLNEAPQQITLRFSPGVTLDQATLGGISVVQSGGANDPLGNANDRAIAPGSILVDDLPNQNQVVIRFADTLPDDTYRITIKGGAAGLKTTVGDTMASVRTIDFRLDLGAMVVSVVPQPVSRSGGALAQNRDQIVVHFNGNDPLAKSSAETTSLYRLFAVDAAGNDVAATVPGNPNWIEPTGVVYDAAKGTSTLTFAPGAIADGTLYRLQIGGAAGVIPAATATTEGSDDNSSFTKARDLGQLGASGVVVTGSIAPQATVATPAGGLGFPSQNGAIDSPGHRDIPADSGSHGAGSVYLVTDNATKVSYYNFKSDYGSFNGVQLQNAITETQKQRAREIFEIFSRYTGIRFVESDQDGFTVATGDIRAADPTLPVQSVAGVGGGNAIMNASLNWGQSEYGGYWFRVAMHEIGHVLGLSHSYDCPTIMGKGLPGEAVFPADYDIEQLMQIYPANGSDVDVYKFTLPAAGKLSAETIVARPGQPLYNSSKLDSLLTLYRQDPLTGRREMVARNDDSFGRDSFLGLDLAAGTYFLAVSSTGNDAFNPEVSDSGYGGRSDGDYQLKMGFQPASVAVNTIVDATGTPLDGDRDGEPGGIFSFWFNTAAADKTVFVDKAFVGTSDGTVAKPYTTIAAALATVNAANAVAPGSKTIIRIVGNDQNTPYQVGTTLAGDPLPDGATFNVPKGVTVMIDAGAVFKLRAANIDVGSASALVDRSGAAIQVLGTPGKTVTFTSYHDDTIGGDSDGVGPPVSGGQWGGIVLRQDSDAASKKAFVNSIAQATLSFGGGQVRVDSQLDSFAPITLQSSRPALLFNAISKSAGAAISANPDSFEESNGRVGPELRGNRLLDNSINGLFIRVRTDLGGEPEKLEVPARLRSTDIVYVLQDNLLIDGGVGGYLHADGVDTARKSGRLSIDPGVIVKLQGARIELERGTAQLIAEGTAGQAVIFTSLGDNRFGAGGTFDTNGNLPDVRTAGDWGGIVIDAGAKASIDHAYLGYGGGQTPIEGSFDNFNVVEVHQGDLRLAHSRIENNAAGAAVGTRNSRGGNVAATVFARGAQPVILGNDFRDNLGAVVSINANSLTDAEMPDPGRSSGPLDRDSRFDGNRGPLVRDNRLSYTIDASAGRPAGGATGGMEVRGEEIDVESVWDDVDIVHVLRSEIIVQNLHTYTGVRLMSQVNASLVVKLLGAEAGFTAAGYGLDIDDRIGGTVQAVGQPGYPVVLTSLKDDTVGASLDPLGQLVNDTNNDAAASAPTPGDWRSLKFLPMSNDRNVAIIQETEKATTQGIDTNATAGTAQGLGVLAPNFATGTNTFDSAQEKSGDDVRRLGFEVHGHIATDDPTDVDVYSFTGYAGSEVWFDIDKTSPSLDTMVELLDAAGNVRARSVDAQLDTGMSAGTTGLALPLTRNAALGGDHYSINPKDAGMRVVLPGDGQPAGTAIQYFVRVRSQPRYEPTATGGTNGSVTATDKAGYEAGLADPAKVKSGATSGAYELRVRLRQLDEKPGSTVRYADIRYPTIGIDVQGLPRNTPLVGETGENVGGTNETFASAQYVGNLLQTDRNTISIAGTIANAGDVDWYSFALNYEQIQSIGGVNGGQKTWATVFDLDYGDGIRGDLTISVYDDKGRLLYVGRDSNVASDQPGSGQGADTDDLSRGSFGTHDPFIGSVQMPAGNPTGSADAEAAGDPVPPDPKKQLRYYVAVSSNGRLPAPLSATFDGGTANALVRLEPVNSVTRVVEDHIGFLGYTSGPAADKKGSVVMPSQTTPLFDVNNLSAHVTPFTLSDVKLFVATSESLVAVDPMRGGNEGGIGGGADDLYMRPDGKLYSYRGVPNGANTAGVLSLVDAGDGKLTVVGNDSIPDKPTATKQTDTDIKGTGAGNVSRFALSKEGVDLAGVAGQLSYATTIGGNPVSGVWTFSSNGAGNLSFTEVSRDAGCPSPLAVGSMVNDATSQIVVTWNGAVLAANAVVNTVTYTFTGSRDVLTTDSVDALAWNWSVTSPDQIALFYSVGEGSSSRLYQANPANGSAAAAKGQPWGRKGNVIDVNGQPEGVLGNVTGMAFMGGQLYGVDTHGYFFTINVGTGAASLIDFDPTTPLVADPLRDELGRTVRFGGLTIGPQNLYDGTLANTFFAIDSTGVLRAFGTDGKLLTLFDRDDDGTAESTSIDTKTSGATGLAFSPLDVNLWHVTSSRGEDAGHGISPTLGTGDNTRDGAATRGDTLKSEKEAGVFETKGGQSMYFGFEGGGLQGVSSSEWASALGSNPAIPNTYNLPGGAYGSLTSNAFSLAGSTYADKPTLYFNYFLESDPTAQAGPDEASMQDSARVLISIDGGKTWDLIATNNPTRSTADKDDCELPATLSASADASALSNQQVQQLFRDGKWRQARIDLGHWAGRSDVRLRIDFSTAGAFDATQKNANGDLINTISGLANKTGSATGSHSGQRNNYEGFYVDDFIVGFAERGEMVTGAAVGQADFFTTPSAPVSPNVPFQNLQGEYQLEIRRGTEYGRLPSKIKSDVLIERTFDTNAHLTVANGLLGDSNHPREQGQFIIEGNLVSNAKTYGISIDAGRDGATNAPFPGVVQNTAAPNSARLVPGVVVTNNVLAGSGTAGILFSGEANAGTVPAAAVPFGRITNNTISGGLVFNLQAATTSGSTTLTLSSTAGLKTGMLVTGPGIPAGATVATVTSATDVQLSVAATATAAAANLAFSDASTAGTGVQVNENAGPTLLNNLFANLAAGVTVDVTSRTNTVVGTSAYWNTTTQVSGGGGESQAIKLDADPFVNAAGGNYYLRSGSRAIDSGLNSLADRPAFVAVKTPLGISDSPIIAPERDLFGQLRDDDPNQASQPGLGSNVFKDRGAIDRVDFTQPTLVFLQPTDNGTTDKNPAANAIRLEKGDARGITRFVLQLNDTGVGIDRSTVTKGAFKLERNGTTLEEGKDYVFGYLENVNRVVFEAAAVFSPGATYTITAMTRASAPGVSGMLTDLANNQLLPNSTDGKTSFVIQMADVPGVPGAVVGTAGDGQVGLAWSAADANGDAVTDYLVEYTTDATGASGWTRFSDGVSAGTTATVTGLTNGTAYLFRVAAVNSAGQGDWSTASQVVAPHAAPSRPTNLLATGGDSLANLTWTASDGNGAPITDYIVEYTTDLTGATGWSVFGDGTGAGTAATVTGLVNGTSYVFRVTAVNDNGRSLPSTPSAVVEPLTAPGVPTGLTAFNGDGAVTLTWTAPASNGGRPVTDYVVQYRPQASATWLTLSRDPSTNPTATVAGLTNGTAYVFQVAAVTSFAAGPFSGESAAVTPRALAPAPTRLTPFAGNGVVRLAWTAPRGVSRLQITDYIVQFSTDGGETWTTANDGVSKSTRTSVGGLTNGTAHIFRVAVVTTDGVAGAFSTPTAPVVPYSPTTRPAAPTGLVGIGGGGVVSLTWGKPPANEGAPATRYLVQYRLDLPGAKWVNAAITRGDVTHATIRRLVPGRSYVFRVAARNVAGGGAFSESTVTVA